MGATQTTILIMAAGTGGHVFPALSIAQKLQAQGVNTEWLGTRQGMENNLLENTGIKIHQISVKGLKGNGILRMLMAPIMLAVALIQSMRIIFRVKPACVLGMGGFVSGPGGVATKLMGRHLVIHEQNAVPGFTNQALAKISDRVFEAFPDTFKASPKVIYTGNPLRKEIAALNSNVREVSEKDQPLHILVLGGSQGALAINEVIPKTIAELSVAPKPELLHQTGKNNFESTKLNYQSLGIELSEQIQLEAFIDDMPKAYAWADLVICRSGASTVSEIAAVGLPSILIPYPHHSDQQQSHNAKWLVDGGAAVMIQQSDLNSESLKEIINKLQNNREKLNEMGASAKALAICNADELIAAQCLEFAHV
ncbi:MAG: undecaprenyldiphospho-muramoylpentapeptide beta-N-acetylglucosaminyltransferase [SAR86 cluster bacterium]|uniref:UDP-N-acetylglucosamine--N-acetylmuramyl-(pentapeptide) pyrophosphoryl-undecaprenol N-acetylglucosamine transferase n=1 Tax=SAR86 cluster bacterium TaxID=2030880 RepID=A0A2A5B0P8_9GAMM|nr:MAG: undecaprenyldiphospho-muramoylpentapeptide beta-N-acetylglucosaminyltransferase [SAR86 cluster bacterium]